MKFLIILIINLIVLSNLFAGRCSNILRESVRESIGLISLYDHEGQKRVVNLELSSALEMEMNMSPKVMELLKTTDGTIKPILEGYKKEAPMWLYIKAKLYGFEPINYPWHRLSYIEKKRLIVYVAQGQQFFKNRTVKGLTIDNTYIDYRGDLKTFSNILDIVEFQSPENISNFGGIEMHFRGKVENKDLLQESNDFLAVHKIVETGRHIHTVKELFRDPLINKISEIVKSKSKTKNELESVVRMKEKLVENATNFSSTFTEFYRIANLVSEMNFVIYEKLPIKTVKNEVGVHFDHLRSYDLSSISDVLFKAYSNGDFRYVVDEFKAKFIGLRFAKNYDGTNPYGLEFRAVASEYKTPNMESLISRIEYSFLSRSYLKNADRLSRWAKDKTETEIEVDRWYFEGNDLKKMDSSPCLDALPHLKRDARFKTKVELNDTLMFLIHDWSKDPLLYDKPLVADAILEHQILAMEAFVNGEKTMIEAVGDFMVESGLYEIFNTAI